MYIGSSFHDTSNHLMKIYKMPDATYNRDYLISIGDQ